MIHRVREHLTPVVVVAALAVALGAPALAHASADDTAGTPVEAATAGPVDEPYEEATEQPVPEPTEEPLPPVPADAASNVHAGAIVAVLHAGVAGGYADGLFRPREDISRGQLTTLLVAALGLEPAPAPFADVSGTHAGAIGAAAAAGLVAGIGDDEFAPNDPVVREQMATLLAAAFDLPAGAARSVPADAAGSIHAAGIAAVLDSGIASGYGPEVFGLGDPVSRGQLASFLATALGLDIPQLD